MGLTVKIYGYGWVGKAMHTLFPEALIQDPKQNKLCEHTGDIAFIAVPTPLTNVLSDWGDNPTVIKNLDTSIVEGVVKNAKEEVLIIRSTVNPGDCDRWERLYNKNICFMPEYLGETPDHPLLDKKQQRFLVIGGRPQSRRKVIELFQQVYNANVSIRQVSNLEAEVIKLSENRAISFKVAQCQELYDACEAAGVDYYTVREAVYGDDPRFNLWWTFIYPSKRGFNSKCIPKDVYAWAAWAESVGYTPTLTKELLERNESWLSFQL